MDGCRSRFSLGMMSECDTMRRVGEKYECQRLIPILA